MILIAVFLLSLSSLAFEVLLTRVFSVSQWNHLSFMVISIALLGFAASGAFLSILDARKKGWEKSFSSENSVTILIILYTITAIVSFTVLNRIPLDYFKLPVEPIQMICLLTAYLVLALPFFFTGFVISLAYACVREKTGLVYFSAMTGSGCGAIIPGIFLPFLGEEKLIILAAIIPLILLPITAFRSVKKQSGSFRVQMVSGILVMLLACLLISPAGSFVIQITPSQYKALSQILQFPDTRIMETVTTIRGRTDRLKSRYIRFAPGLSLKFTDALPRQWAVFRDGDNQFTFYNWKQTGQAEGSRQKAEGSKQRASRQQAERQAGFHFSEFTLPYSGYVISPYPEHVLIIQNGGGSGIPCAVASGARNITIVEQNPQIARIASRHYDRSLSDGISVVSQNPRAFLARSDKLYSVIHIENWGTSVPGSAALTQEYVFTTYAFREYLSHLTDQGILMISRKLLLPPSDSIRMWASAYESLRYLNIRNPEKHIAILRNWDVFTMIVSAQPMQDISALKEFALNLNFDLVYLQGITHEDANKFNIFEKPYHFLEIGRLAQAYKSGAEKKFFQNSLVDAAPQGDSRPFPGRFLKWQRLKDLYKTMGSRPYSLLMSGEIVVVAVFFEALVVSVILLVLPVFRLANKTGREYGSLFSHMLYFLSVGAGFMFVELFFIKEYTLLFGDPIISFTVVLSGILIFSGAGGFLSQKAGYHNLRYALVALTGVLILFYFVLDRLIHGILGFPVILQYFLALLFLFPVGLLMGLPFTLGMRHLLKSPVQVAYAWAANGCASVLTSIISAQLSLSLGIPAIMICAILAYFLALLQTSGCKKNNIAYRKPERLSAPFQKRCPD